MPRRGGKRAKKTRRAAPDPVSPPRESASRREGREPPAAADPAAEPGFADRWAFAVPVFGLLVAASYFPALQNGFVWDDRAFTEADPVRELPGLWRIWFSPQDLRNEGHYWPLVYTTFWLEHKLWGYAPAGYHAVNVLLHFANTLLVWRVLARLAVPGAWAAAAVFAVHPVHVEAVAWVIGRKDLLATLFYLSAVLAWLRFDEGSRPTSRPGCYVLALALFAAGLLCKSIGVTLPVVLAVLLWWKRGGATGADLLRLAPFFAVGIGIVAADLSYYEEILSIDYTMAERVLIAAHALWFYLGKLLWPAGLVVIYPHWEASTSDLFAWGYVIAAAAVAAALWLLRHRIGRGPLAGALFFAVTLSPVLGFVDYGYMQFSFVADRYQYLAGIGPLVVLAGIAAHGAAGLRGAVRWGAAGGAAVVLVLLGALTWRQAGVWRDELTFFNHVIAHNPQARDAHLNLAKALFESGRAQEALAAARTAVRQRPDAIKAHYSAALILLHLGRAEEAERRLRHALDLNPDNHAVQHATGLALSRLGRLGEAQRHHRRALEIEPRYPQAHVSLGGILMDLGRLEEAELHLGRALELAPRRSGSRMILAALKFRRQRYEEALDLYRSVAGMEPGNAMAWSGAGAALHYLGRHEEALRSIDRALALDPALEEARANREAIRRAVGQGG